MAFENALSPRSGCKNAEINQTALCRLNSGGWLVSVRPGEGALWQEKLVGSVLLPLPPRGGVGGGGCGKGLARCLLSALHWGGGEGLAPGQADGSAVSGGGAAPGHQCSVSEHFRGTEHGPVWAPAQTRPSVHSRDPFP